MRFLVDENLSKALVDIAIEAGHAAIWVRDCLPGAADSIIVERLMATRETLVTRDVRFASLAVALHALGRPVGGVVLIRVQGLQAGADAWRAFLEKAGEFQGVAVVTTERIRFRRLLE